MKLRKGSFLVLIFSMFMSVVYCPGMSKTKSRKIALNKKKVSLRNKQKYSLKLKGVKSRKVKWSSSDKKVATVKKGVVNAKKVGKCVVTAKYAKKKYKCIINVVKSKGNDTKPQTQTKDVDYTANPNQTPAPPVNEPAVVPNPSDRNDFNFSASEVSMEAQHISGENALLLKISNKSDTDISADEYFMLEFYEGGQWISVDFKDSAWFVDILLVIKKGTDYTQRIDLGKYFTSMRVGKYRISKQIGAANYGIIRTEFIVN